jgi:hypothetical protein
LSRLLRFGRFAGAATLAGLAGLAAPAAGAADRPASAATDAYRVASPPGPWQAASTLEPAGQLRWSAAGPGAAQASLRLDYEGLVATDRVHAVADWLRRAKAAIAAETEGRPGVQRSGFEPDSIAAAGGGGLAWQGFRVTVQAGDRSGTSWRWIALHPRFPATRRAFVLSYDELSEPGAPSAGRLADVRRLAGTVAATGRGLGGPLAEAWLDARAAAFAARIDSAQRLCWRDRVDAEPGVRHLGFGPGLALEGDFYLLGPTIPADSVVDAAPSEYGAAFDRNRDGRLDLILVNRGLLPVGDRALQAMVAVYADEDFDGRIDALLLEDVDRDGDRRVDARLLVHDANGDGRADTAHTFLAAAASADAARLPIDSGRVRVRRVEAPSDPSDFMDLFRTASTRLAELERARAACSKR